MSNKENKGSTMTTEIKLIKLAKGFAVKFPFDLKDKFREAFRSAKWNPSEKQWEVGPRSKTRLEQWIAEVNDSGAVEAILARDERDMTTEEVKEFRAQLDEINGRIGSVEAALEVIEANKRETGELLLKIVRMGSKLDEISKQRRVAQEAADKIKEDINAEVSKVVNLGEINHARNEMLKNWRPKADAKGKFNEMQANLKENLAKLNEAGLHSKELWLAVVANHNRPDRDKSDLRLPLTFEIKEED